MNEEKIMSKEAFDELIENFEIVGKLTLYGRKSIKYHINKLQQQKQNLINWLEEQNKFHYVNGKIEDNYVRVDEVLRRLK